jgi:hypothetical protein
MSFWTAFKEESGKWSFSRLVAGTWFLIIVFAFLYSLFTSAEIPSAWDNLTYTFFGSFVVAKGGQAWLEGRKK